MASGDYGYGIMLVHLLSVHNEPLLLSLRYAHIDKDVQTWQVFIAQDQVAKRDIDHHITTRTLKQGNTRLRDTQSFSPATSRTPPNQDKRHPKISRCFPPVERIEA